MKTESNARLYKYKIDNTRNTRRNVTIQHHLYFAPIAAIYGIQQEKQDAIGRTLGSRRIF